MPLTGMDFTVKQQQLLRAAADIVNPGMTDQQVLDWATSEGTKAAVAQAVLLARQKVREDSNLAARQALAPLEAADEE